MSCCLFLKGEGMPGAAMCGSTEALGWRCLSIHAFPEQHARIA